MKMAWAEVNILGKVQRIFRNYKTACERFDTPGNTDVLEIPRKDAIASVRNQIWERTKGDCEWCGKPISEQSLHMHEVIHRGKGGEVSLQNSVGLCYECHFSLGHGDRAPRFGEKT